MKKNVLMKISIYMKMFFVANFLLVATLSYAKHCCDFKIDALNRQALSLKEHCVSIKEFVDCISTDCCGGGESCPCAPIVINSLTETIDNPGSYCLSENVVTTITVTTNAGVAIDLNGYTASSLILGNNCKVKNGTVYGLGVGSNAFVSNVRVNGVTGNGAGSSVVLVDCSRLTSLQNVERVVMTRCTGDGTSIFQIFAGVKDVTMYDSLFASVRVQEASVGFERLSLYRSLVKGNVEFYISDSLREFSCYQSVIAEELQFNSIAPQFERMLIEESQIGRISAFFSGAQVLNASIQRSVFKNGISTSNCSNLLVRKSQLSGPFSIYTDNNVMIDNISVVTSLGAAAFGLSAGKNILLTDCCATALNQTGYVSSTPYPENLNLVRCFAKGCANGFNVASDSCLMKDCVCDGATNTGFIGSDNVRAVGNIALSVGGIPVDNFDLSGAPFDPIVVNDPSVSNDAATNSIWRNMSFELP